MAKLRIALVVGTRPDAIKTAPVFLELSGFSATVEPYLISTGQHREMLDQVFATFGISPSIDLQIMQHGQSLAQVTTRCLTGLDQAFEDIRPDFVMAQGDTSTTFVAALAAFYRRVPFGHIEAGLRTGVIDNPFPEEFNRRAAALVTRQHYAPTSAARENLLNEGYGTDNLFVTGNTGIDAVLHVARTSGESWFEDHAGRVLLVTTHRRENWGEPQKQVARAVRRLADAFPDLLVVVAMHRNPIVRESLIPILEDHPRVRLIEPPDYAPFVQLMKRADLILTDSGGVQEEAPSLAKPVLVLRETTERPEGVEAGNSALIGTDEERVFSESSRLLSQPETYQAMATARSPYGDGRAAQRIRFAALRLFGVESEPELMWDGI